MSWNCISKALRISRLSSFCCTSNHKNFIPNNSEKRFIIFCSNFTNIGVVIGGTSSRERLWKKRLLVPSLRASSPFGDIMKSTRARGTREETRSRAAYFALPNRQLARRLPRCREIRLQVQSVMTSFRCYDDCYINIKLLITNCVFVW